jgi:hypothetical protein
VPDGLAADLALSYDSDDRNYLKTGRQMRTSADRFAVARLSTRVSAKWTFTSEHSDSEGLIGLPLLAGRFAPHLDDHNTAPAG